MQSAKAGDDGDTGEQVARISRQRHEQDQAALRSPSCHSKHQPSSLRYHTKLVEISRQNQTLHEAAEKSNVTSLQATPSPSTGKGTKTLKHGRGRLAQEFLTPTSQQAPFTPNIAHSNLKAANAYTKNCFEVDIAMRERPQRLCC